jgi:hypothetical protein
LSDEPSHPKFKNRRAPWFLVHQTDPFHLYRLKSQLQQSAGGVGPSGRMSDGEMSDERIAHIKDQMRKEMETSVNKGVSEEAMAKMKDEIERKAREEMEGMMKERERTEEEKKRIARVRTKQPFSLMVFDGKQSLHFIEAVHEEGIDVGGALLFSQQEWKER